MRYLDSVSRSATVFAIVMSPAVVVPGALAQSASSSANDVAEIVVTAQKRAQSANDVPISLAVLSGDVLADRGFRDTTDLAVLVPGFSYSDSGLNTPVYTLRGVGFNDPSLATTPTVAVYVNEVPLTYPVFTKGAALDLERVEVLKGPQGILYGQNSTGGAVNYIARGPTDIVEAGLSLGYSRFDTVDATGYVSGPLSSTLRARVSATTTQGGEWQKNYTRDDELGAVHRVAGRLLLDWQPSESVKIEFGLNGWKDTSDTLAPQLVAIRPSIPAMVLPEVVNAPLAPANPRAANWIEGVNLERNDRFVQAFVKATIGLTDSIDLVSISAFSDVRTRANLDRGGMDVEQQWIHTNGAIKSYYQELRVGGNVPGLVNWLVGANYRHDDSRDRQEIHFAAASTTQNVLGVKFGGNFLYGNQQIDTWATFANADWQLPGNLELSTGLRYTKDMRDFNGCTGDGGDGLGGLAISRLSALLREGRGLPPVVGGFGAGECYTLNANLEPIEVQNELNEDNLSLRVGLNWKPARGMLVYASYNRGYKSGAVPTSSATYAVQLTPIRQERVEAYEAGAKLSLLNRTLQLNGAIFRYDYKDKQLYGRILDPVFGPQRALVNIPNSRVQGFEADAQWRPVDGLTLHGDVTHIKTKIIEYEGYSQTGVFQNFAGKPFNFAPKWQYNAGFAYEHPLTDDLTGSIGADVSYRSRTTADFNAEYPVGTIDPAFVVKKYTTLDLRAGVGKADGRWTVTLWGKNVTNAYRYSNVYYTTDAVLRTPERPATYGVTLDLKM